ncbi:MAG: GMC family oxidoreductase [Devosia sp.]
MPSQHEQAILSAAIDRLLPGDDFPSATGFGAHDYILQMLDGDAAPVRDLIRFGLGELGRQGVLEADAAQQDALLRAVETELWFLKLVELTAEGIYADPGNGGNRDAASWRMLGYDPRLPDGPDGPPKQPDPAPGIYGPSGVTDWDVIIVGSGGGGGSAAGVLAAVGKKVLVLERGRFRDYANSGHRDHLRNHRLFQYGHNTGPEIEGNPRVYVDPSGAEHLVPPHTHVYQPLASAVGGGTLVYGMQAWRFHPLDFRMASTYGVPEGSSLADWPVSYEDLEPWYDRAEWEIGVSGATGGDPNGGSRQREFPMPPLPPSGSTQVLRRGADQLGLKTFAVPLLLNSRPRDGRAACIQCGTCIGFPCPVVAKNGTQNTVLKRALVTGNCTLITGVVAERIATNDAGKVVGVEVIHDDGRRETLRGSAVVVAAAAVETARLLLASATSREPAGLGNKSDHVGRHMQGHYYPGALGLFDEEVDMGHGPGPSIATTDFNHGNPGIIGGAMLADDFVFTPMMFWQAMWPEGVPRWGAGAKHWMRRNFHHITQVRGPVQEIPTPQARVELDRYVRDSRGRAVARMSGTTHMETVRTARFMKAKAEEWLRAAGAKQIWGREPQLNLSGHQHQAGTARMSATAETGVTDKFGRVWGHDNLFVADGSLHVTNGGYNPALTIMALGLRVGDHIARSI